MNPKRSRFDWAAYIIKDERKRDFLYYGVLVAALLLLLLAGVMIP